MILGLIEHDRGKLNAISLEMLTMGRTLAAATDAPLEAILIGADGAPLLDGLAAHGVTRVHLVQHEQLTDYAPDAWAHSVVHLINEQHPEAVLGPGTDRGSEVMARVAARLNLPLAANCTGVQPGDAYHVTRVRWGGSLLEEALLKGAPKLLTVAPHVLPVETAAAAAAPSVNHVTPELADDDLRVRVTAREKTAGDKISLTDARVVIGGGRGVGSAEGFAVLEELAELIDGAVGGSRVVTNLGWRPHADQIGQTGTRIAPDLYVACGISGAIQHMVGCKGSRQILAINTDRDAPIMAKADYAAIGDLHEIIPAVIERVRQEKQM